MNNFTTQNRFRTAAKAYAEIKSIDPNTSLTENYIRTLMTDGTLPVINIGSKTLVEMNTLFSHLEKICTHN